MYQTLQTTRKHPPIARRLRFKALFFVPAIAGLIASACVTVNVNFPESTVQKATDDYVHDLYEKKEKKPAAAPSSTPASARLFELIPAAYADESIPSFKVDSPKTQEIKERMRAGVPEVLEQKRNGNLGETNDGWLAIKAKNLPPLLQQKIETIVKTANAHRKELYKAVLELNGMSSEQISTIQRSFARSFQSASPSGTWIQDSAGVWTQKP